MLQKKIDRAADFLTNYKQVFRCPLCKEEFVAVEQHDFCCQSGHKFDLSKKGTLFFLTHQVQTDYNKEMLSHRQNMIQAGLYEELIQTLKGSIAHLNQAVIVDVGCGEGSFLSKLAPKEGKACNIGFDISKAGVQLATNQEIDAFWCVADLTNLPFQTNRVDCLLNIFSPSHYEEFRRVLTQDGLLIKVIPESGYLKELRALFYEDQETKQSYSNQLVLEKIHKEMTVLSSERKTYTFKVTKELQASLRGMSPIQWGATAEAKKQAEQVFIPEITVDVHIIVAKK
ncbi:methyltransferase domain-containing protein [Vagococcus entomophilus]|uniref:50S rRNA methyltransferase n=1 Tax=Vagococcus entomophilus TaxID=1160095 RepID=A0A430AKW5_9ENTE|nr:methyltransferase domain-containing protein [Vagococcus entomophilus]RSU08719.1 50S rRNA methyltransferase [Vagococcus entomophilus]